MKVFVLIAAAIPAVIATPAAQKANCCENIDWLISANHAQSAAATFCSSFNKVSTATVTKSATTTVAGSSVTVTKTATSAVAATTTVTSTATVTTTTSTKTYATQTCTPDGTAPTSSAVVQKRGDRYPGCWTYKWDWPYPTPKYNPSQISAACSCIATTPTSTVTKTATITRAGATTTVTTTQTATTGSNTISQSATTTATSTVVQTATETIPIDSTHTYTAQDGTTFYDYDGMEQVDFQAGDLQGTSGCGCDADGSGSDCVILGQNYGKCFGFNSCQDICSQINQHSGNLTCVGVTMNGPDESGNCYFKGDLHACGTYNPGRRSGLIELNGYKYAQ